MFIKQIKEKQIGNFGHLLRNYIYFTLNLLRNPPPSSCHKLSILMAKDFPVSLETTENLFCLSLRGVALRTTENCSTSQGEPQASMRINMGPYSQAKLSGFWTSLSIRCCVVQSLSRKCTTTPTQYKNDLDSTGKVSYILESFFAQCH